MGVDLVEKTLAVPPRPAAPAVGRRLALAGAVLVHVTSGDGEDALPLAVDLAERSGAALFGLAAEAFEPSWFIGMDYSDGSLLQAWLDSMRERMAASRARFEAQTRRFADRAWWCSEEMFPADAMAKHAGGADWVLAVRPGPDDSSACAPPPADLILESGLPVLLAPAAADPLDASRILVGWRNTPEAHRAIAAAMPLLVDADLVVLAEVDETPADAALDTGLAEVRRRLERWGCRIEVDRRGKSPKGLAASFNEMIVEHGVDLAVVGGYGRSRVREWVLGGLTRGLLTSCPAYVLFCH